MFIEQFGDPITEMVVMAMAENRIRYAVQPVQSVEHNGSELYGECLVRLINGAGRVESPVSFVPQLEASGNVGLLDAHMIHLALQALEQSPDLVLGCNLSTGSMQGGGVWRRICSAIAASQHAASRLIIEVTETHPVEDVAALSSAIAQVRALGCRVAIDDFGVGFLSPSVLLGLAVDIVKIDASLLRDVRRGPGVSTTLHHIIGFAACIAPIVVVEGVEDEEQRELARSAGATHVQGYLIGRPLICDGSSRSKLN